MVEETVIPYNNIPYIQNDKLWYYFFNMLYDSNKYHDIGTDTKLLTLVTITVRLLFGSRYFKIKDDSEKKLDIIANALREILIRYNKDKPISQLIANNFCKDMFGKIESIKDLEIFVLVCEKIIVPVNKILDAIPNDDSEFVASVGGALLEAKGPKGLANIINVLDEIGSKGCIAAERSEIVQAFGDVRKLLSKMLDEEEIDIVLTAFCQEFERRAGQKRKGRAGRGVEGTTSIILDHFGIKTAHEPEHFTTGLEIDKWIKTKDGWIIGISCKRTLRERWKQAYTTNLDLLNRHKIRQLWHVITFDRDLSDEKITEMGSYRAIFYLPDESTRLKNALNHPGMRNYVRPMTRFVDDLKALV
jgi:hypothetical protein